MTIQTKIRALVAASAFTPLAVTVAAYGSFGDEALSRALALGLGCAAMLSLACARLGRAWILGRGLRLITERCSGIRAGRYRSVQDLPPEGANENELVSVLRTIDWMAHRIAVREEELQARIDELEGARRLLERQGRRLAAIARTDALTGLSNRRHFFEHLDAELERGPEAIALLLVDIDYFKSINDRYGHQAGDEILKAFGLALRRSIRRSDLAARVGGEEFAILLPGAERSDAERVAGSILASVRSLRVPVGDSTCALTCSIGVAALSPPLPDPQLLYKRADDALYQAKHRGRDRLSCHGDEPLEPDYPAARSSASA